MFKSAFVMMVTFGADMRRGYDPGALASAALIAPFFVFSATAGELANRCRRTGNQHMPQEMENSISSFYAVAADVTNRSAFSSSRNHPQIRVWVDPEGA